jgi:hypothetical protein
MTDEQRLEDTTEKLDDSNDDVEAHRRRHIADEPKETDKTDDDGGDDVEAHRRR